MTLGQRIRYGATWLLVGNASYQAIAFVAGIILARLLVPADFGMLVTIQVFTGLAGFVAGGGMGQALVRARDPSASDYRVVFTLQMITGLLVYAVFFAVAPAFARWYSEPIYVNLLRVSALSFLFRPLNNLPASILQRNMRFKAQAVVRIMTLLTSSTACIAMAYEGYGVWSLVISGLVGGITSAVLFISLARWRPALTFDLRRSREIARYGALVSVTAILGHVRSQVCNFILSRTLGPTSVGLFNKGTNLALMPHAFITRSLYNVLFRALAIEQDNLDRSRYLFLRSITLVSCYGTPLYVGLYWLAEPLVRGLYGARWVDAALPLTLMTFAWPFWLVDNLSGAVLAARNWLHREVLVQAATPIILALSVLIALPYGLTGVAWAMVGASAYSGAHMYWLATRSLRARWTDCLRAFAPATMLNAILIFVLAGVDRALPAPIRAADLLYVSMMAGAGGLTYAIGFLYLPIAAIHSEQVRWKRLLRLPGDN